MRQPRSHEQHKRVPLVLPVCILNVCIGLLIITLFDLYTHRTTLDQQRASFVEFFIFNPLFVLFTTAAIYWLYRQYVRDLAKRQERLKESEQRYRELVESQWDLIARITPDGIHTYVNDAYCRMFGQSREAFLGSSFQPLVHEDDLPKTLQEMQALAVPPYRCSVEIRVKGTHGLRWLSWDISAIHDEYGDVIEIQGAGRDITDRKRMEDELRQQKQFLTNIFASIQDGLCVLDTSLTIQQLNPNVLRVTGADAGQIIGHKCYEVFHGITEPCQDCPSRQVLATGESAVRLSPRQTPMGMKWDLLRCYPLRDTATGEITGIIEYISDVTKRKNAEEELRMSEATNRALLRTIPDLIFRFDREGRYLSIANEEHRDLYTSSEQMIGKTILEVLPDDAAEVWMHYSDLAFSSGVMQVFEYPLTIAGEQQYFEARMIACGENEVIAIVRNITEAIHTREEIASLTTDLEKRVVERSRELKEANARLEQVNAQINAERAYLASAIDILPIPMYFMPSPGGTPRMNLAMRQILDSLGVCDFDEIERIDPASNRPLPLEQWPAARALRGEVVSAHELILRTHEQRSVPVMVHAAPIYVGDQLLAAVAAIQDTTVQKEAERAKDEFLALVSHELLTPLTSILGWSQMAQTTDDTVITEQAMAVVERNARRQKRLVDDLLDISRIIHNKLSVSLEPCECWHLVEQAVECVQQHAQERGVTIELHDAPAPLLVNVDPARVIQVINNLINNAIKFSAPDSQIDVRVFQEGEQAVIEIHDTGMGIALEKLPHLFQPFQQVHRDKNRGGLGLGLALAKAIVELHNGEIIAYSAGIGHGSTFTVRLPLELRCREDEEEPWGREAQDATMAFTADADIASAEA